MSDWVGVTLSKVRIEEQIGRGGMAEVFVGTHTTLNRKVAVKVLHDHLTNEPEVQARFRDEAQAVANLRHPNIVQVYDFDVYDGRPYIVMELLEGPPLSSYLSSLRAFGGRTLPSMAATLTKRMASALDYAHNIGIIHRDIKPANIVLTDPAASSLKAGSPLPDSAQPILTDFGIAHIASSATQTVSGSILGTPAYMSPEQVQGEKVDNRSDIYSLGIVAYELLAGHPPFNGDTTTPASVMYKQIHEAPPKIADLPEILQVVLDRALAKDANMRYASAGDFSADLTAATVTGHLPSAVTVAPTYPRNEASEKSNSEDRERANRRLWNRVVIGAGILLAGSLITAIVIDSLDSNASQSDPAQATIFPEATSIPTAARSVAEESPIPVSTSLPAVSTAQGLVNVTDGQAEIQLEGLPPTTADTRYVLWRESEDSLIRIAEINEAEPSAKVLIEESPDSDFFNDLEAIILSLEPVSNTEDVIQGTILLRGIPDSTVTGYWATLRDVIDGPVSLGRLLSGMEAQGLQYDSHLGFAVDASRNEDYPGTRRHSEHVINISEGASSQAYADWNDDGRIENPGDAFGLIAYLELLHLAAIQTNLGLPPGQENVAAVELAFEIENVLRSIRAASTLAQRISATDTILEAQPLAEELEALRLQAIIASLLMQANDAELVYKFNLLPES